MVLLAAPPATVAGGNSGSRRVSSEHRNDSRRSGSRSHSSSRPRLLEAPPTSYRDRSDRSGRSGRSRSRSLVDIPEDSYYPGHPSEHKHSSRSRSRSREPSFMDRITDRMAGMVLGTDLDHYEHSPRSRDGALVRSRTVRDDDYGYDEYGSSRRSHSHSHSHRSSSHRSRSHADHSGDLMAYGSSARSKHRHDKPLVKANVHRPGNSRSRDAPLDVTESQWDDMEKQADEVLWELIGGRWVATELRFVDKEGSSRR